MHIALVSVPFPKLTLQPIERKYSEVFFQSYAKIYLNHLSPEGLKGLWQVEKINQGLLYIASSLLEDGFDVSYYSFGSNPYSNCIDGMSVLMTDIFRNLDQIDILCLYSITCNYHLAERIAREAKIRKPDLIVGLGGPHATASVEKILSSDESIFDFIGIGEGERTLVDLANSLDKEKELSPVPGVFIKEDGHVLSGPKRTRENPVRYPIPAYNLAGIQSLPAARIFPNRGCPNSCAFCADPWRKEVTYVNLERIAEEVDLLYSKYGTKFLYLGCEDFLCDEHRAIQIAEVIHSSHSDIKWVAQCRAKPKISQSILETMSECGCIGLEFGVESSDQAILDRVGKNITVENARRCFKVAKNHGFYTHAYWMIGLPGESLSTAEKTIMTMLDWADRGLVDSWEYKMFFPYPGTPVYTYPERYGIKIHTHDYRLYHYALDPVISSNGLSPIELREIYLKGLDMSASLAASRSRGISQDIGVDLETIENMF